MFGIDFYPTPKEVIEQMLQFINLSGKVVLEPSAGKGNIVDYVKQAGAKEVLVCEIDNNLRKILSGKCHVIESDFLILTADQVSHVDFIIMNPPFSKQEAHIMHAWDIAPAGCQIISLCNYTMLDNRYTRARTAIKELININGHSANFGDCFSDAERNTGIDIGCVWLNKPGQAENEFEGYFDLYDYEQNEVENSGIVRYDFVQDIVSRYVESVQQFDEVDAANKRISQSIKGVVDNFNIRFGAAFSRDNNYTEITRDVFKKELQKAAWQKLFTLMNMQKYVTRGVMSDINKFVEQQIHVPFTVRNVYLMIQMIAGTHGERMNKVLVEAFETICSFSKENSTAGEGWRTNSDYMVNRKFIKPYVCEYDTRWPTETVKIQYSQGDKLDDIIKALCHLTGKKYEDQIGLSEFANHRYHIRDIETKEILTGYDNRSANLNQICDRVRNLNSRSEKYEVLDICNEWGGWMEWGFFRIKGFKKGTMHFEFIDENVWMKFNQTVASIKGWRLPRNTKKAYSKKEGIEVY